MTNCPLHGLSRGSVCPACAVAPEPVQPKVVLPLWHEQREVIYKDYEATIEALKEQE